MDYSLCSYSLHRTFAAGEMDIFGYVEYCQQTGFTQLDPWMKHLEAGYTDPAFLEQVKAAASAVALPFGCIAVDGAHIYEPSAEARAHNRQVAYRWLDIAQFLGATQVRIDAGGRDVSAEEIFAIVVDGYKDIVARAAGQGIEVIIENHWGPFQQPDNLYKLLDAVPGLGLLFDSYNWPAGTHEGAWPQYAPYARATHFKTFSFDAQGNDPEQDIARVIGILQAAGYRGCWGIESTPYDGNEVAAATQTLALLKRVLQEEQAN
ncbi:MAG: sugar phosphate isomerase/epimerase [Chloroflexota bacterium]|nr:sugar phosphate isomerase/epimerase [Chloroflexota bacterium]